MAYSGTGTYVLPAGQPVVTGTVISSTTFNTLTSDLATALSTVICKDGQSTPTANLPMGGFKLTGLGAATSASDSARLSTVQNSQGQQLGTIVGTNTITAVASPTLTAYTSGQTFRFAPAGTNTGATTLNIDSLGAKNVFFNGFACAGGEIPAAGISTVTYDGTQFNLVASAGAGTAPFSDAVAIIKNSADATKLVKVSAAGVTTATTRTLTAQDKDGVIAVTADLNFKGLTATLPGGNTMTVTLAAGTLLNFNDGTSVTLSAAISVTVPSGQAMGTVNAQRSRLWAVAMKNSGTPELALMNALSGTTIATIPLGGTISTTAIAAAPSAQIWYSTTLRATQAFCVVGYVESTQAAAGTWASAPTAQGYGPGLPLPGQIVQLVGNTTGAVATGLTAVPYDDTIPQNTEGDQFLSQAITPTSAANILDIEAKGHFESTGAANCMSFSLFQDAIANALVTASAPMPALEMPAFLIVRWLMVAGTVAATTIKARAGAASGTTTFNGLTAARKYGGAMNSYEFIREIMA